MTTLSSHTGTLPALALVYNALVWGLSWIAFKALHAQGLHPLWSTAMSTPARWWGCWCGGRAACAG